MKFKLNEEEFGKLPQHFQEEYEAGDNGEYTLKVEGGEDTGALKRAKDHEKTRRQAAEQKLKDLQTEMSDLQGEYDSLLNDKSKSGNLEKKWQEKLEAREKELNTQVEQLNSQIHTLLIDNVADQLAAELSDSPSLIRPHIKSRLAVESVDGKATTRVIDADGEVSPLTLDELKTEFKSNPDFAAAIRGSNGSGSGANGGNGGNGGATPKKPDFSNASPKEIADYLKSQKN